MADSFELKAIITAVDKLSGPLRGMQKGLKGFQKELSGLATSSIAAGAGILGMIGGAVKQSIDFESSLADVRKVVDGLQTPEAFQKMGDDILGLSTRLPMAASGIAQIVAAAGQAGIARNELLRFAEDATKMGVAFDFTAEEAGSTMATWRTAFKLTQDDVVALADKINYLGNTGPASAKQISEVVTTVGSLAATAHVSTGDLSAIAATITGMGVQSDVASTGIQNFMLALTNASTSRAKAVLQQIGMTPEALSKGMVDNSKATMVKVLEKIGKLPESKKAKALEWLFGRESIKAIAPMLNNLDLLKANLDKVSDAKQYSASMDKEYAARAATTANQLQLFKNGVNAVAITLGDTFLPAINEGLKAFMPYLEQGRKFVRENPELVKAAAKFAFALIGVGSAIKVVSGAMRIFNTAFSMTPARAVIGALIIGATLIIQHWDKVGPVVSKVWNEINRVVNEMGGWEAAITAAGALVATIIGVQTVNNIAKATTEVGGLMRGFQQLGGAMKGIGTISLIAGLIELGLKAQEFEKQHPWLVKNFVADALNSGFGLNPVLENAGKSMKAGLEKRGVSTGWMGDFGESQRLRPTLDRAQQLKNDMTIIISAPPGSEVTDVQAPQTSKVTVKGGDKGYSPHSSKSQ